MSITFFPEGATTEPGDSELRSLQKICDNAANFSGGGGGGGITLSSLHATSPISYNNITGTFSLGVVPIGFGGTGQSSVPNAANVLGVKLLLTNPPTAADVPSYVGQLGQLNGRFYQATTTGAGDWLSKMFSFPTGINTVGDKTLMPSTGTGPVAWFMNGSPGAAIASLHSNDAELRICNMNPYQSGSGLGFAYVTTTPPGPAYAGGTTYSIGDQASFGGVQYRSKVNSNTGNQPDTSPTQWATAEDLTNSDGVKIYVQDPHARSDLFVGPQDSTASDLPGFGLTIMNNQSFPFALAAVKLVGSTQGNYSAYQFDPAAGVLHIPKWVEGKWKWSDSGWIDLANFDLLNGLATFLNLSVQNTLTAASTGTGIQSAGDILGTGDGLKDIGGTAGVFGNRFNNIFAKTMFDVGGGTQLRFSRLDWSGGGLIRSLASSGVITIGGNNPATGNWKFDSADNGGHLIPKTDSTYNFGDATHQILNIYGVNGILSGTLAVTGTSAFTGAATFGTINVNTALNAVGSTISAATLALTASLSAVNGVFSGNVSGVAGTFSGAVSGTTGTFSAAVSGTTGTFTGAVAGKQFTGTQIVVGASGTTYTVDASTGTDWVITLNNNCTITVSNLADTQQVTLKIINTASNYTVAYTGIDSWPGNTVPTQTVGVKYDVVSVKKMNGKVCANSVQNFTAP